MKSPAQILIADDNPANLDIFRTRLTSQGYDVLTAADGEAALAAAREHHPDLILLDVMMPKMDGIEVCRRLKGEAGLPFMPIILVTAKSDPVDVVKGLEAGAEEYLTKPVDQTALVARVKSMLRIKALHDQTQDQAGRLEVQASQLAEWNRTLEERVAAQLVELERVGQLKRFFSPHLADLIVSSGDQKVLESHRREIVAVFCDLRRFTAFSETAEPEEVMQVLREYHGAVGPLIFRYEATLEHFAGDGIVSFFNDPVPCRLVERWSRRGHDLALGLGLATGYATMGQIGFESLFHYGAIGSVLNTASRLCDRAKDGQILISRRVAADVEEIAELEPLGELELRGLRKPMPVYNVTGLKDGGS
jgi:DNA-binding response OmpR family regulator